MSTFHLSLSLDDEPHRERQLEGEPYREQRQHVHPGLPLPAAHEDLSLVGPEDAVCAGCLASTHHELCCQHGSELFAQALPRPAVTRSLTQTTAISADDIQPPNASIAAAAAAFAEGTLPLSDVSLLRTSPASRTAHNLRLPSFNALGIAAPHPDHPPLGLLPAAVPTFDPIGAGPLSLPEDPLHVGGSDPLARPELTGAADLSEQPPTRQPEIFSPAHEPDPQYSLPFTPPAEAGHIHWSKLSNVRNSAMDSPPTDPESRTHPPALAQVPHGAFVVSTESIALPNVSQLTLARPWVPEVLATLGEIADTSRGSANSVRILSHALPSPSIEGHTFPTIIEAIRQRCPVRTTTWINVFHALPGQFQLSDLPTSPPNTPGPAIGGDDYFTTRVFDSAVRIDSYGENRPALPHTAVAPGTVDISLVERYIPPTNAFEFQDIFSTTKQSLLHDRLIELSPNNGTLVLIYPTKTGAMVFKRDYLGPILEPLLRSMCIVHGIPLEAGKKVAEMLAVNRMLEYSEFRARLQAFCNTLNDGSPAHERNHGRGVKFSVEYASKQEMLLPKEVWAAHWYTKQEKPRISHILNSFFSKGSESKKLPDEQDITASNLVKEILDRVSKDSYTRGEPTKGVEFGVYVVKKSTSL